MGQVLQNGEKVQIMSIFFLNFTVTKRFNFFQDFLTVLKSFCPVDSQNSFILVLAHFFLLINFHRFYPFLSKGAILTWAGGGGQ